MWPGYIRTHLRGLILAAAYPAPSLSKSLESPYDRIWLLRAEAHVWPLSQQLPLNPGLVTGFTGLETAALDKARVLRK